VKTKRQPREDKDPKEFADKTQNDKKNTNQPSKHM
jgi:hypothetical protein